MRYTILLILAAMFLSETVCAQSSPQLPTPDPTGWSRLQSLDSESEVSVSSDHHRSVRCTGVHVSSEGLSCEFRSAFFGFHSRDFPRAEVKSVRLHHTRRNFWIGVGAASALGFVAGTQAPGNGNADARITYGLAAGAVTGVASAILVYPAVQFLPGQTIYRRP